MVAISKQLFDSISTPYIQCNHIFHTVSENCFKNLINIGILSVAGSSKFLAVIYLLQTFINRNKISKKYIKSQILAYFRSIVYCTICEMNFFGFNCLIRNCSERFYYYNIAICGGLAGLGIFIESEENKSLNSVIFVTLVAESLFRSLRSSRIIFKSLETLIFMICSSALMYFLKIRNNVNKIYSLWFYYPSIKKLKNGADHNYDNKCSHLNPCNKHVCEGFIYYSIFGYLLQVIKSILPKFHKVFKDPKIILNSVLNKEKVLFGMVLGNYVAIYRMVCCLLRRKYKSESANHSLIAGFAAGIAYFIKPNLSLLSMAVVTSLQLFFERLPQTKNLPVPIKEFFFITSCACLFHIRFLLPEICPKYVITMMNTISNGLANRIYIQTLYMMGIAI